jgi:hypothetical protein
MTWFAGHGITGPSLRPANAFNATGPGATWQYNLVDTIPPVMTHLFPERRRTARRRLSQIEVTFSETVLGVQRLPIC